MKSTDFHPEFHLAYKGKYQGPSACGVCDGKNLRTVVNGEDLIFNKARRITEVKLKQHSFIDLVCSDCGNVEMALHASKIGQLKDVIDFRIWSIAQWDVCENITVKKRKLSRLPTQEALEEFGFIRTYSAGCKVESCKNRKQCIKAFIRWVTA